ncbi:MAG: hypothetical protein ACJ76H_15850, partial [Bacteriovoracaceae bacterium]
MTKEKLRWFLGGILKSTGLSEPTRRVYFSMARHFVRKLPSDSIDAAWIRRSTANGDFYPLVSDIDLTILVNDQNLQGIRKKDLRRSGLMQDVQFIGR